MNKEKFKKAILAIIVVFIVAGMVLAIITFNNSDTAIAEQITETIKNRKNSTKTFDFTVDDLFCNIKHSRSIAKVNITIEVNDEKALESIASKEFLIRDEINKTIRNKTLLELQGKEGQTQLQEEIRKGLIELFDDENILNVYFNDFVIQ